MSVIRAPRHVPYDLRQLIVPIVVAGFFVFYFLRLWFLQVAEAESLQAQGERSRETKVEMLAPRGEILDRKGQLLAGVRPNLVLMVVPSKLQNDEALRQRVADISGLTLEDLDKRLKRITSPPALPAVLLRNIDIKAATRIAESEHLYEGVSVKTLPMRYYPDTKTLGHVLGYVWVPTEPIEKELEAEGITPASFVGREGIEREYEKLLMGKAGSERVQLDARRRPVASLPSDHPQPGKDLILGIDGDLQAHASKLLAGRRGAIVALDPKTGDVLAMVSAPGIDRAWWDGGISNDAWQALLNDPSKPLYFRPTQGMYQPGSTFKILTTLAAYKKGVFDANRPAYCNGGYNLGRRRFRCLGVHGSVTFNRAMQKSCNAYFADLAVRAGYEAMCDAAEELHFGTRLGLDFDGEKSGVVPNPEWWGKVSNRPFSRGDLVNMGCGQGELLVTPLQMASLIATVANEGKQMRPRFVRAIRDAEGKIQPVAPEVIGEVPGTPEFWSILKTSLQAVVTGGTARGGQIQGIKMAGKTGSAENAHGPLTHSWFVAYAPADNPQIAIAVMAENAGHGGTVAVPIGSSVIRTYLSQTPAKNPQGEGAAPQSRSNAPKIEVSDPLPIVN